MLTRQSRRPSPRARRGQMYLFGALLMFVAIGVLTAAILTAVISQAHWSRQGQPVAAAQTAIATVNADLQAATMYDANAASQLAGVSGSSWAVPAPAVSAQPWYVSSDTQPVTFTVQAANTSSLKFTYVVPNAGGGNVVKGTATVPIIQKAPAGCDPLLPANTCTAQ